MYSVMLVDDEPVIKKGLACFVKWEQLDCEIVCEASNGIEALEYLKSKKIDIVVTDIKMPGLDGIELSKYIYENYPGIKIIILTAFADFSYAQSAIKYNVVDFIIKTKPVEKIPGTINKAKELIIKEKHKENKLKQLESAVNENVWEISEKFIKDVFNGIIVDSDIIKRKAKELDIELDDYFIITYEINNATAENEENTSNDSIVSVKNFITMALKDYHHYTSIMNRNLLFSIVAFKDNDTFNYEQSLPITCTEILAMIDDFMKNSLSIGISGMHKDIAEMSSAYNEAIKALLNNFYSNSNISTFMAIRDNVANSELIQTNKYHDEIVNSILSGNQGAAISYLLELFHKYKTNNEPIENTKVSCILLCSLCFRHLANYMANLTETIGSESEIYQKIQCSKSIQNLFDIICKIIEAATCFLTFNERQYSNIIKEVNNYLRDNFCKGINLQSIAKHVHVNSSYLSRLYKKETTESLIDAINKLRIEKARKLLKDPSVRIFEVASAVGINDPAYFTHVFIKYTGMSPKEYKLSTDKNINLNGKNITRNPQ